MITFRPWQSGLANAPNVPRGFFNNLTSDGHLFRFILKPRLRCGARAVLSQVRLFHGLLDGRPRGQDLGGWHVRGHVGNEKERR